MKNYIYVIILLLILYSCAKRSNCIMSQTNSIDTDNVTIKPTEKILVTKKHKEIDDSLIDVIFKQFSTNNVIIKDYNAVKNIKKIVPSRFHYVKVPDSIAYRKIFYKNGTICCEGMFTFFDNREIDADEIGTWKYRTPEGQEFEKFYEYSVGVKKDKFD